MSIAEVIWVVHLIVEVMDISARGDVESSPTLDCEPSYKLNSSSNNNLKVKEIATLSKASYRYSSYL